MKSFFCEFEVRSYELDAYNHVNNAVYLQYAEYARFCMLKEATGSVDYFKNNNVAPVVVRVEIDYREACVLGDRIIMRTRIKELRTRVVVFEQCVFRNMPGNDTSVLETMKPAATLVISAVAVDQSGKAVVLPSDFSELFQ